MLLLSVLIATLTLSDAQSAAQFDALAPSATYHRIPDGTSLREACGAYVPNASVRIDNGDILVRCVKPNVKTSESVVTSLSQVPVVCGGYKRIEHTEVFEDGSILAHCRTSQ